MFNGGTLSSSKITMSLCLQRVLLDILVALYRFLFAVLLLVQYLGSAMLKNVVKLTGNFIIFPVNDVLK